MSDLRSAQVRNTNDSATRFRTCIFLLAFPAVYTLLYGLYAAVPDRVLRDQVHYYGIVVPAAALVRLIAPDDLVVAEHGSLTSSKASLSIVRGCDGAGLAFLLIAAVAAAPLPLKPRLRGMMLAVGVSYVLNELRVVGLYFVAAHRHDWFGPLHNYLLPTFLILTAALAFFWWTTRVAAVDRAA